MRHKALPGMHAASAVVLLAALVPAALVSGCRRGAPSGAVWTAGDFELVVDGRGQIAGLVDKRSRLNYAAPGIPSPLLAVRVSGKILQPLSFRFDRRSGTAVLSYDGGVEAVLRVAAKETHLTFEVLSVSPAGRADLILWGPYATTLSLSIGETVGVVRDAIFALGIQALNPKTLGGYPWQENDCMPEIDLFEQGNPADLNEKGKREVLYRVEAAKPEIFGSTLQAYCRDRGRDRVIANWGAEKYVAPRFDDGGLTGSKIALFGCPTGRILDTIGAVEIAENLPHPMIDGRWGKVSSTASAAYMILDFGEADINRALDAVERAGLHYLYHSGPFRTWGHFALNETMFPHGTEGLRRCVALAQARGIHVGVHTLSNFITTNDAYVTPVPDPRLAKVGTTTLVKDVDARQVEITIAEPDYFNEFANDTLRTAVIGKELVRYKSVTARAPWRLLGCERGVYGTTASAHRQGEAIAKLADHGYKVFLSDAGLGREMAGRLAELFNEAGLRQISFDGLEGNRSTGMGNYGEILFTKAWYDRLAPGIRSHYIADASRTSHFFWHIYSRMNWGEPWYAGFRESQTEYRLKNQAYFRRNLMPGMLGWFQMRPETSIEDVEWLLERSAGFEAGFAFVTSYESLDKNGAADAILKDIGRWERARLAGVFSDDQKRRMQDIGNEFHLEEKASGTRTLTQIHSFKFRYEEGDRMPGEPVVSIFPFRNPVEGRILQFILTAVDAEASEIRLALEGNAGIALSVRLKPGWIIQYLGGAAATLYDPGWHKTAEVPINQDRMTLAPGEHKLSFTCRFSGRTKAGAKPALKIEVRIPGRPEAVG